MRWFESSIPFQFIKEICIMSAIKQLAIDIAEDSQIDIDVDQDVTLVYIPREPNKPYIPSRKELEEDV